nr:N-acetyltransferase [Cryptomonas curvata]
MEKNKTNRIIGDFLTGFTIWTSHYFQLFVVKNNRIYFKKTNFPIFPIINKFKISRYKKKCIWFNILEFKETKYIYKIRDFLKNSSFSSNFYKIKENNLFFYITKKKLKIIVELYFNHSFSKFQDLIYRIFRFNNKIKISRKLKNLNFNVEIVSKNLSF